MADFVKHCLREPLSLDAEYYHFGCQFYKNTGGELSMSIPILIPLFLLELQLVKKRKKKKETSSF